MMMTYGEQETTSFPVHIPMMQKEVLFHGI